MTTLWFDDIFENWKKEEVVMLKNPLQIMVWFDEIFNFSVQKYQKFDY